MSEKIPKNILKFPKRFLWGASTSAHQVEGNNHNQWSVWELENARSLAEQAKFKKNDLAVWEEIKGEAANPQNYVSDIAADHYNRYKQDFDILKNMNMNAFRFSIEWSRVEPEEGRWDAEAIEHYRQYLLELKARNIEPMVTLMHWTLPVWFADKGGFAKRKNVAYFVRFVAKILEELGKDFRYICTFNEPEVYMYYSYVAGDWPPQIQSKLTGLGVYLNVAYAHKKVYKLARRSSRKFQVGLSKNCMHHYPGDDAKISKLTAKFWMYANDYFFLDRIDKHIDWLGLNYYFSSRYYGYRVHNPDETLNDMGWDMRPSDIQFVVERLYARYKTPIIVTETGLADRHDKYRKWWIMHNILALFKALQNGVDLQGYLHWSLLDNFEWSHGHWPNFGLIHVDRKTMKRTPRQSAIWFAKMIKQLRNL